MRNHVGTRSIIDHGLSVLVLIACAVEFLPVPGCATPSFFPITLLALVDVTAGRVAFEPAGSRAWDRP